MKEKKAYEMALEFIRKSAESDCPEALYQLGQIFELGGFKVASSERIIKLTKKSLEKAYEYY